MTTPRNVFALLSAMAALLAASAMLFAPSAMAQSTTEVDVGGDTNTFTPDNVQIQEGDSVLFTWQGGSHNVTFEEGESMPDTTNETGTTFERTFDEEGTFNFECTVHPAMTGSVEVAAADDTDDTTEPDTTEPDAPEDDDAPAVEDDADDDAPAVEDDDDAAAADSELPRTGAGVSTLPLLIATAALLAVGAGVAARRFLVRS